MLNGVLNTSDDFVSVAVQVKCVLNYLHSRSIYRFVYDIYCKYLNLKKRVFFSAACQIKGFGSIL